MIDDGYAATQILNQLHDCIIEGHLNDKQKSVVAEKMAVSFCFEKWNGACYFEFLWSLKGVSGTLLTIIVS